MHFDFSRCLRNLNWFLLREREPDNKCGARTRGTLECQFTTMPFGDDVSAQGTNPGRFLLPTGLVVKNGSNKCF